MKKFLSILLTVSLMVSISLTGVHAEITDFKSDLVTDNMVLEEDISDSL
ncbi:hypothetical protein [Paenilisteria rocourtiae]|uniref:PapR protein n=1 Tax=Listeria rocourtiae TaxID=647910 RepID=A0A4R6ZGU4_9LIST|nr:hypothetical protein [Listeria rocourtiae]MBC1605395.1 hypothetical protein [Listeria rocourtiae]TDR51393.1 hypothetical protein DFP96_11385 [Listeria rocourtiae]